MNICIHCDKPIGEHAREARCKNGDTRYTPKAEDSGLMGMLRDADDGADKQLRAELRAAVDALRPFCWFNLSVMSADDRHAAYRGATRFVAAYDAKHPPECTT